MHYTPGRDSQKNMVIIIAVQSRSIVFYFILSTVFWEVNI